jgi:VanZ family protein
MITLFSLWPIAELPAVPGTDKAHHLIAYALLMFPTAIKQHKYRWLIAIFFIFYSGAIELIQPYANRYGEWMDLAANVGGLLIGMLLAQLFLFLTRVMEGETGRG